MSSQVDRNSPSSTPTDTPSAETERPEISPVMFNYSSCLAESNANSTSLSSSSLNSSSSTTTDADNGNHGRSRLRHYNFTSISSLSASRPRDSYGYQMPPSPASIPSFYNEGSPNEEVTSSSNSSDDASQGNGGVRLLATPHPPQTSSTTNLLPDPIKIILDSMVSLSSAVEAKESTSVIAKKIVDILESFKNITLEEKQMDILTGNAWGILLLMHLDAPSYDDTTFIKNLEDSVNELLEYEKNKKNNESKAENFASLVKTRPSKTQCTTDPQCYIEYNKKIEKELEELEKKYVASIDSSSSSSSSSTTYERPIPVKSDDTNKNFQKKPKTTTWRDEIAAQVRNFQKALPSKDHLDALIQKNSDDDKNKRFLETLKDVNYEDFVKLSKSGPSIKSTVSIEAPLKPDLIVIQKLKYCYDVYKERLAQNPDWLKNLSYLQNGSSSSSSSSSTTSSSPTPQTLVNVSGTWLGRNDRLSNPIETEEEHKDNYYNDATNTPKENNSSSSSITTSPVQEKPVAIIFHEKQYLYAFSLEIYRHLYAQGYANGNPNTPDRKLVNLSQEAIKIMDIVEGKGKSSELTIVQRKTLSDALSKIKGRDTTWQPLFSNAMELLKNDMKPQGNNKEDLRIACLEVCKKLINQFIPEMPKSSASSSSSSSSSIAAPLFAPLPQTFVAASSTAPTDPHIIRPKSRSPSPAVASYAFQNFNPHTPLPSQPAETISETRGSFLSKCHKLLSKISSVVKDIFSWIGSQFGNFGTWFANLFASNARSKNSAFHINHPSGGKK